MSEKNILDFVLAFRLELESGALAYTALNKALNMLPPSELPHTREALRGASAIDVGLQQDARTYPILHDLSLAMTLSTTQGSQLGMSLDVMTESIQERIALRHLVRSELASVKATIGVLALLPVIGVGFGFLMGINSLSWLLHTFAGQMCLVVGIVCELCGVMWTRALVRRAVAGSL